MKNLRHPLIWFIFLAFLAITFFGVLNHEPWRDEAQSWLLVRDLNLWQLIRQMPFEGSPPLWHLLIFPLAKLGLPYAAQAYLHYTLAAITMFLFLFFSPLPKIVKIILPFSYFFLFEYVVLARNYNLTILLLFLIATLYQQRHLKPIIYAFLIGLLFNTNIHSFGAATILSLIFFYETLKNKQLNQRHIIATAIMIISAGLVILILLPYPDQLYNGLIFNGPEQLTDALTKNFVFWRGPLPITGQIFFVGLWLFLILSLLKKKTALLFFLASSAWLAFILVFKYSGSLRHAGLFLIFFLTAWWLSELPTNEFKKNFFSFWSGKLAVIIFCFGITIGLPFVFRNYRLEYLDNFSGSQEMAEYLKNHNLLNQEIIAYPSFTGNALLPYLPNKTFYQADRQEYGTFITWDKKFQEGILLSYSESKQKILEKFPHHQDLLFLTNQPWAEVDSDLTLIFKNTKPTIKKDEFYYLYKF